MMMSFKGEIKDLLDNTAGPRKGQAEEKRLGKKTATTVKGRASTPDPKSNMPARPIDFSKIHTPMDRARKPVRHIQPDGTKKVYSDARTLIQDKKTQQRSESASTSTFRDNFNVTSGRHSRTNNDSRTSEVSARSGPSYHSTGIAWDTIHAFWISLCPAGSFRGAAAAARLAYGLAAPAAQSWGTANDVFQGNHRDDPAGKN